MKSPILFLIKGFHTLVFLFMSACILYVLYAGLTRRYDIWLALAIGAVLLEVAVFVLNRLRCPLTALAQRYGDTTGNDFIADIFLPPWAARLIPPVCGGLFVVSLVVLAVMWLVDG
ncbi:MAG: hypothetical protein H6672_21125 [Anaerolineaceae bacterium]|nr:hypothetical protein [Anaerolineaceae bacterium]